MSCTAGSNSVGHEGVSGKEALSEHEKPVTRPLVLGGTRLDGGWLKSVDWQVRKETMDDGRRKRRCQMNGWRGERGASERRWRNDETDQKDL